MKKIGIITILCVFLVSPVWAKIKVLPLVDIKLTGGSSSFESSDASFRGNLDVSLVPVVKFNQKLSLLPQYQGKYTGSKGATELEGGGKLHQKEQEHSLSFKLINKINNGLEIKSKAGYKSLYLRETMDEDWGKGIFDYNKAIAALELEKLFLKKQLQGNLKGCYEYYQIRFPNYESLSSKSVEWKELSAKNPLDYNVHGLFLSSNIFVTPKTRGGLDYNYIHKEYTDQLVVTKQGNFSSDKRKDDIHEAKLSLTYILPEKAKTFLKASYGCKINKSTQNNYDSDINRRKSFAPNFYGFTEHNLSPQITLGLQKNTNLTLSCGYNYKKYTDRDIQDKKGVYQDERLHSKTCSYGMQLSYPMSKGFSLEIGGNINQTKSNMAYEKFYNYNYNCKSYSVGIGYQY
ncbi:MAG: hypothetical protein ABH870_01480 [bacterium]